MSPDNWLTLWEASCAIVAAVCFAFAARSAMRSAAGEKREPGA